MTKELYGNYEVGEEVKVIDGPFNDFMGKIDSLNYEKVKLKFLYQCLVEIL